MRVACLCASGGVVSSALKKTLDWTNMQTFTDVYLVNNLPLSTRVMVVGGVDASIAFYCLVLPAVMRVAGIVDLGRIQTDRTLA